MGKVYRRESRKDSIKKRSIKLHSESTRESLHAYHTKDRYELGYPYEIKMDKYQTYFYKQDTSD